MASQNRASSYLPDAESKYSNLKLPKPDQVREKQSGTQSNLSIA